MKRQILLALIITMLAVNSTKATENIKFHYFFSPIPEYRVGNEMDIPLPYDNTNRTYVSGVSYRIKDYYSIGVELITIGWISNYLYDFEVGFSEKNTSGEKTSMLRHHIDGFGYYFNKNLKHGYWNDSSIAFGAMLAKPTLSPTGFINPNFKPNTLVSYYGKFEKHVFKQYPVKLSVLTMYIPEVGFKLSFLVGFDSKIKFWEHLQVQE